MENAPPTSAMARSTSCEVMLAPIIAIVRTPMDRAAIGRGGNWVAGGFEAPVNCTGTTSFDRAGDIIFNPSCLHTFMCSSAREINQQSNLTNYGGVGVHDG